MSTPPSLEQRLELLDIEQFLYQEAALLDAGRYSDWLALLTDDVRYSVPQVEFVETAAAQPDPLGAHHFDETKQSLRERADWLGSGFNHSELPASLRRRIIGNVRVLERPAPATWLVASNFLLWLGRWDGQTAQFAGSREDRLVCTADGALRIARRTVHLAQPILPRAPTTFF